MDNARESVRLLMDAAITQGFIDGTQHTASELCADVAIKLAEKMAHGRTKAMAKAARALLEKHGDSPERRRLERAVQRSESE